MKKVIGTWEALVNLEWCMRSLEAKNIVPFFFIGTMYVSGGRTICRQ